MRDLEVKEKQLNKLKTKADTLLKSNHPASDKIEVWEREQHRRRTLVCDLCGFLPVSPGIQGHAADPVELAAADYQVHRHPPEGERSVQPGNGKRRTETVDSKMKQPKAPLPQVSFILVNDMINI